MPIYEFKCKQCNTINEFLMFNDRETVKCKACGSTDLFKLISAPNAVSSAPAHAGETGGSCCGSPHSCNAPGSCCGK